MVGVDVTLTVAEVIDVFVQPFKSVPETVIIVVVLGLIEILLPFDPFDHVYVFAPVTDNVAVCPLQIAALVTDNVGTELTVTVAVLKPLQDPLEPVIVKIVVDEGLTFNGFVLEPESHVYVVAPFAINVAVSPAQIVALFTAIEIAEPIVTDGVADVVQVPLEPITVTNVLVNGLIVKVDPFPLPEFQS